MVNHDEPERHLFRIVRPRPLLLPVLALAAVEAAHLADALPEGPAPAYAVLIGAGALLIKECVRSR